LSDQNFMNIGYFFSSKEEHLREVAAIMLADRLIPAGFGLPIDERLIRGRVVNYCHKIFLALEREHA